MATTNVNLYLYLGRRDKAGIRILAKLLGRPILASRVENLDILNLPVNWTSEIKQIVYDNRMLWELWLEASDTYDLLKASLKNRGYTNLPMSEQPEFVASNFPTPIVNVANLPTRTIMVQRG